ncbi:MAG TPA: hypothetical protein PKI14_01530 [Fervidobacterium sp.]|nr:hypothetical protein [Fervidobacterium sp.]
MDSLIDKILAVNFKFNRGDFFRHKRTCHEGKVVDIVAVDTPGNDVEIFYEIEWQHLSGRCKYLAAEVDDEWEQIINLVYGQANDLPSSGLNKNSHQYIGDYEHNYTTEPIDMRKNTSQCIHEWVEYNGFSESFTYCKKCDKKVDK